MTNELTMLLSGRGFAQIRDAAILSYMYRWHNTIHQAIGVYIHALGNPRNGIKISGTRLPRSNSDYAAKYGSRYTHTSK